MAEAADKIVLFSIVFSLKTNKKTSMENMSEIIILSCMKTCEI